MLLVGSNSRDNDINASQQLDELVFWTGQVGGNDFDAASFQSVVGRLVDGCWASQGDDGLSVLSAGCFSLFILDCNHDNL